MQSPIGALLYGIAIWFVWVSLIVASAQILTTRISGSALFVSMQMVALAALVLGSTVLYLREVGESSFGEGFLVGLSWVLLMIALDLAHSVVMPEPLRVEGRAAQGQRAFETQVRCHPRLHQAARV
jgi:ABC-type proline/glycine betaine transport system permease subunit